MDRTRAVQILGLWHRAKGVVVHAAGIAAQSCDRARRRVLLSSYTGAAMAHLIRWVALA
uniref:Uncharacterized protein n=1 Tax=Arundo donax TaxID=35708 RepID=A0A0A9B9L8_ARUDO